jgi:homoserine kinase type II
MAVYTEVSDLELESFLDAYDAGKLLSFKGIAEGVENSNYMVVTDRDRFILTLYEKRVAPDDLPFFLGLMDHLSAQGFACPRPIKDKFGASLKQLAGRPACLISFLEGLWVRRPGVEHCGQLGERLAEMHLAADGFKLTRENALSSQHWRGLLDQCTDKVDTIVDGLFSELDEELGRIEQAWPDDLPRGVIHADLFPDNVFFLDGVCSGFIDFYFACTDAFAYDIAICLNAWCFEPDISFNITKARALLSAYKRKRPFTRPEYDALPMLARGAAMRFLLTRAYDWLNTPDGALVKPKDPREYLKISRFHRDISSARAYGIDP